MKKKTKLGQALIKALKEAVAGMRKVKNVSKSSCKDPFHNPKSTSFIVYDKCPSCGGKVAEKWRIKK